MLRVHPATTTADAGDASSSPLQACSLCRGAVARHFAYADEAGAARALYCCRACGLLQTWPLPSDAELRVWYQRYDVLGQRDAYYAWVNAAAPLATPEGRELAARFALVQRHVRGAAPRLLEVGSGHGFFLSLAKQAGFAAVGVELNAAAAQASRERFGVDVRAGTIDSAALPENHFDAVVLGSARARAGSVWAAWADASMPQARRSAVPRDAGHGLAARSGGAHAGTPWVVHAGQDVLWPAPPDLVQPAQPAAAARRPGFRARSPRRLLDEGIARVPRPALARPRVARRRRVRAVRGSAGAPPEQDARHRPSLLTAGSRCTTAPSCRPGAPPAP